MDSLLVMIYLAMAVLNTCIGISILTGKSKSSPLATGLVWLSTAVYFLGYAVGT